MAEHGLQPPEGLEFDGDQHYFAPNPSRPSKKSGFYKIYWDARPTAIYGCYRENIYEVFSSKASGDIIDPARRRKLEAAIAEEKKRRRERLQKKRAIAIKRARRIWNKLEVAPMDHPYLKAKQIGRAKARWNPQNACLYVPLTNRNENLVSLQRIFPNGDKRFLPGAPIKDAFFITSKPASDGRLYICEGFATAVSVAYGTSCAAVAAFSNWNLESVAKIMRKAFGGTLDIVICADNDVNTEGNPGLTAAIKAARACGGFIAVPEVINEGKKADWNDIWCEIRSTRLAEVAGLPAHERKIAEANAREDFAAIMDAAIESPIEHKEHSPIIVDTEKYKSDTDLVKEDPTAWMSLLICDSRGQIVPNEANISLMLQYDSELKELFQYDIFKTQVSITRVPPWEAKDANYPRQATDRDRTSLLMYLQRRGIKVSRRTVDEVMKAIGDICSYDPLKDTLLALNWDGVPRIETWLIDYCAANDDPYVRAISRKFLIGAVARALSPGCKMDTTLVLEGAQGTGKSTLVRNLAMRPEFSSDAFPNLRTNQYPAMSLRGIWLMEVPELTGISKADVNAIKEFISRSEDKSRDPYSAVIEDRPRRCVFIATTNQSEYLRDPTGARRFWPVSIGTINQKELQAVIPQLWAEAVVEFENGETWYLTQSEAEDQIRESAERSVHDPLEDVIFSYIADHKIDAISPGEIIWDVMAGRDRVRASMLQTTDRVRVSNCLLNMGYVKAGRTAWCKSELGTKVDVYVPRTIFQARSNTYKDHMLGRELRELRWNTKYYNIPTKKTRSEEFDD